MYFSFLRTFRYDKQKSTRTTTYSPTWQQILNIKLTNKHITYGIYFLLLAGVIGIWIWEFKLFDEFLGTIFPWEERYEFPNIVYGLQISNMFTASILSLVVGIGIFLRNKMGWILITSWFYLFFINFLKSNIEDGLPKISLIFKTILLLLIPIVGLILLMNKFVGIKQYHGIEDRKRIKLNILAIGIGIFLVGLGILKKNLLQNW